MKKYTVALAFVLAFSLLTACGGGNDAPSAPAGGNSASAPPASQDNTAPGSTPELIIIDLSGGWKQTNSNSEKSYQIAMIANETIEIYWKNEDDNSTALYWAGTYASPATETKEYSWDSVNDKAERTAPCLHQVMIKRPSPIKMIL